MGIFIRVEFLGDALLNILDVALVRLEGITLILVSLPVLAKCHIRIDENHLVEFTEVDPRSLVDEAQIRMMYEVQTVGVHLRWLVDRPYAHRQCQGHAHQDANFPRYTQHHPC